MKLLIYILIIILTISCSSNKKYYKKITVVGESNGVVQYKSEEIRDLDTNKSIYLKEEKIKELK